MKKITPKDLTLDKQIISMLSQGDSTSDTTENCEKTNDTCPTKDDCEPATIKDKCNETMKDCTETFLEGCLNKTQQGNECNVKTKVVECLKHTINDCPATNSQYILCCNDSEIDTCENQCPGPEKETIDYCPDTDDSICEICSNNDNCMYPIPETEILC